MRACVRAQLEKLQDQLAAANELKAGAEAKNATLLEREAGLKEALDAEVGVRACADGAPSPLLTLR